MTKPRADWPVLNLVVSCDQIQLKYSFLFQKNKEFFHFFCSFFVPKVTKKNYEKIYREPVQVKDAIAFGAEHKDVLIGALQMDTYEPPMTQVK